MEDLDGDCGSVDDEDGGDGGVGKELWNSAAIGRKGDETMF